MLWIVFLALSNGGVSYADETWKVVVSDTIQEDEAFKISFEDLQNFGSMYGLSFELSTDADLTPKANYLCVGSPDRNPMTASLLSSTGLDLASIDDEQGYAIGTTSKNGHRVMVVSGGAVIGDVYGLYWVMDRIRVNRQLPDINTVRVPALKIRLGAAWGRWGYGGTNKAEMRMALRHSINWVSGTPVLDLVPWESDPEREVNAKNREKTRELINYAHSLHMNYFSFANEFTYHPSLLEEHSATLSPDDPKYWDALQDKFRKLFTALPELDGIELCNDDISGFWDDYLGYDILHENPESNMPYTQRFNSLVKEVQEVVVGEFGKKYFHFTWGLTTHEQHYQEAVFKDIFKDDVPTEGLYLMPKITTGDRWWHQPYNPTFNQTPHDTVVCFETMNYYEGGSSRIFPTFSGQYFQAGLQHFLKPEDNNLKGMSFLQGARSDGWGTGNAYAYVLYRLAWDPYEDMETIARDFCSIKFGPEAAEVMAEIYMMTPSAYKYGLHIEPVSYGQFNSFIHMRDNVFPLEGYPSIDGGREHLEFLYKIYLRCKPWKMETLLYLEHGLSVSEDMIAKYVEVKSTIETPELARELEERLLMTRSLIATNIGYVRNIFAFFDYLENADGEKKTALEEAYAYLVDAREKFMKVPDFNYNLFGVDQLKGNVEEALKDVQLAKVVFEDAPSREAINQSVGSLQARYLEVLNEYQGEAVRFAHFDAHIDGRDILNITSETYSIDHLRWDHPQVRDCTFFEALPSEGPLTVIPKDLYSRPLHPFVLEQPTAENGYTVRIYFDDLPGGKDKMECDLYYIRKSPEALGLDTPWGR